MIPVIVGILAHVKLPEVLPDLEKCLEFGESMAEMKNDKPIILPLRVQQLLASDTELKLYRSLIRIVQQIKFFNIESFFKDLLYADMKAKPKKEWAFHYYNALPQNYINKIR